MTAATEASPARLALRPDVYWAETPGGVAMLTHRGPVSFTGPAVHRLIEGLAPYLDGRFTLTELTADLSEQRRVAVQKLIGALLERDVLRELPPHTPAAAGHHPATDDHHDPDEYARESAFVGYFRDDGAGAFEAYRRSPALIVGDGDDLLTAVALASLRSGLARVAVAGAGDRGADLTRLAEHARRDPRQRLSLHRLDEKDRGLDKADRGEETEEYGATVGDLLDRDDYADVRIVIHVSADLRRARALDRLCAGRRIHLAQAIRRGDRVWLGPIGPVPAAGPSLTSGWRRLAALRPAGVDGEPGPASGTPAAGGRAVLAVVANQLVHGVLRSVTGLAGQAPLDTLDGGAAGGAGRAGARRGQMTVIEAATLRGSTHDFVPHPFGAPAVAATAARFLDRVEELDCGAPLDTEAFSRRAARLADDRAGVFGRPAEGELAQLPLRICQIEVSDPVGLLDRRDAAGPAVTGAGLDFATARLRAALRAFAGYASLMVDPRRLVDGDGRALLGPGDDPDAALDALRSGRLCGHVWGYRLADRRPYPVPATMVFPALRGRPWPPPATAVAAYSWRAAVEAALLVYCGRLTVGEIAGATAAFPRLDLPATGLDDAGRRYMSILTAIGGTTDVYDVTGALGIPTAVCCRDGTPAGCASGRSLAEAAGKALLQAVLGYQMTREAQPGGALSAVAELPRRLRDLHGDTVAPGGEDPPLDLAGIGAALAGLGHHPLVVPLDHDPEVSAVMPYIATVVPVDA
jgi:hypothetical protein